MKKYSAILASILCVFLISCQLAPTKVKEEFELPSWQKQRLEALSTKFVLSDKAVWLDARSFFQYKLSHIVNSHNIIPGEYFVKSKNGSQRVLDDKHYFNARRLSRYGVGPEQNVVVFGNGHAGNGEEWLLVWYLEYLGLQNVEAYRPFGKSIKENNLIPTLPDSVSIWRPKLQERILVKQDEYNKISKMSFYEKGQVVFIDAREREKYLESENSQEGILKINIPWKEFIDEDSRPDLRLFKRLSQMGIKPNFRILVWSDEVSQAATAVMVLQRFGYGEAGLYLGH